MPTECCHLKGHLNDPAVLSALGSHSLLGFHLAEAGGRSIAHLQSIDLLLLLIFPHVGNLFLQTGK